MRNFLYGALILLLIPVMCNAVIVGLNDDVHFDYSGQANDFHIEGNVHSSGGITPTVASILVFGDPGTGNWTVSGYRLIQVGPEDWHFILDFRTDGYIVYCQWIHFGIKFNVNAKNIIANLKGWWTLNGQPLYQLLLSTEYQQVAVTGFEVDTENGEQFLRIMNNTNLSIEMDSLELAVSSHEISLQDMFTTGLGRPGEVSPKFPTLVWKNATQLIPTVLDPGNEARFNLRTLGIQLQTGQFLLMRGGQAMKGSKSTRITTGTDWGWFWEQHGQ